MKDHFGESLEVAIHLIDSPEAANYDLKGSTTVYLNDEWVPLDIATSAKNMQTYIELAMTVESKHEA